MHVRGCELNLIPSSASSVATRFFKVVCSQELDHQGQQIGLERAIQSES